MKLLRIAISAYPTCIRRPRQKDSRQNIAMPFDREKLGWLGYPMVNFFDDMLIGFDTISERDGHTHTHTETARRRLRPRLDGLMLASLASRGKKAVVLRTTN